MKIFLPRMGIDIAAGVWYTVGLYAKDGRLYSSSLEHSYEHNTRQFLIYDTTLFSPKSTILVDERKETCIYG